MIPPDSARAAEPDDNAFDPGDDDGGGAGSPIERRETADDNAARAARAAESEGPMPVAWGVFSRGQCLEAFVLQREAEKLRDKWNKNIGAAIYSMSPLYGASALAGRKAD